MKMFILASVFLVSCSDSNTNKAVEICSNHNGIWVEFMYFDKYVNVLCKDGHEEINYVQ